MPKKKLLPDRKPMPMAIGDPIIEDGKITGSHIGKRQADELAKAHGFKPGFDLHQALENTFTWYVFAQAEKQQGGTPKDQRDFLEELVKRAALMEECLNKMSLQVIADIHSAWPNKSTRIGSTHRIKTDMHFLHWAAKRTLSKHEEHTVSNRPPDGALLPLLDTLIDIYARGTGNETTLSKRYGDDGPYDSRLWRFVKDCLPYVSIQKFDNALGKALDRRLNRYKARQK